MSDESSSESRAAGLQGAGARINSQELERAVQSALRRLPGDRLIKGPILVGIIAYPEGGKIQFKDLQSGPQG
jgi:hypothetical protein